MSNKKSALTAANIRYLLAINELDRDESGAKSSEIAKRLSVTKPSVHTMLNRFCEKGYAVKERYGAVHLTAQGKQLAELYSVQYKILYSTVESSLSLTPQDCCSAVCAILEQTGPVEPAAAQNLRGDNQSKV